MIFMKEAKKETSVKVGRKLKESSALGDKNMTLLDAFGIDKDIGDSAVKELEELRKKEVEKEKFI